MASEDISGAFPAMKYFVVSRPLTDCPSVVHVEINRPEKLNAFIEPMWLELGALFHYLSSSLSVSAIVLSGSHPRAFTTGIDTTAFVSSPVFASSSTSSASKDPDKNLTGTDPARISHGIRSHITTFQASISAVSQCTKPVIAAIHGHCLGLGVDLTLCADVRFCSSDAKFAVKEVDIGLAADIGTLSRLPKLVGSGSWVFDVCLSGRTFGAEEAKREGFVNRVCEPGGRDVVVTEALSWAQDVASKSPVAVLGTKEILKWSWDRSVEDGLRYTTVWNSAMLQTNDVKEAAMSKMQKRTARYAKL